MAKKKGFRSPVFGDVVEIPLSHGFAYGQYVNRHRAPPVFGDLSRVLPGIYRTRLESFTELAQERERFLVFFPLNWAVREAGLTGFDCPLVWPYSDAEERERFLAKRRMKQQQKKHRWQGPRP